MRDAHRSFLRLDDENMHHNKHSDFGCEMLRNYAFSHKKYSSICSQVSSNALTIFIGHMSEMQGVS